MSRFPGRPNFKACCMTAKCRGLPEFTNGERYLCDHCLGDALRKKMFNPGRWFPVPAMNNHFMDWKDLYRLR